MTIREATALITLYRAALNVLASNTPISFPQLRDAITRVEELVPDIAELAADAAAPRYPIHTEEQARYSLLLMQRDERSGKLSTEDFARGLKSIAAKWPRVRLLSVLKENDNV
jgi:hypothetical protein